MKYIKQLNNFIFEKQKILIFLSVIIFIILHKPIEILLEKTIVKYAFAYAESVWYNDIIFLLAALLAIVFVIGRFKSYNPSSRLAATLLAITAVYAGYRFFIPRWNFTAFSFYSQLKYADLVIFISLSNLLLLIPNKKKEKTNGSNSFFDDEPIGKLKDDELGYTSYAELLAQKISLSNFNKSFAIGINGKWGLGKTSFIDILKRKLNGSEIIEINFNAWNSNSPKAIIQDFFESAQESIRPHHSALSRLLISYSAKLVSLNDNTLTQSIQTSVTALTGIESLNSLFNDINSALLKIDKKLIVYIDDLDRLDKEEIVEVIRLIRNTANFHNTFFVVAYDRNYVVNALKSHNPYRQEQFLEKIFQLEISLPYFNKDIFRHKLAEKLKDKLPPGFHETIDEELVSSLSFSPPYLDQWLENMRDVTRVANTLVLNLSKLKGEVVFSDFLKLELLRVKYPAVYDLIFNRTDSFLELSEKSGKAYQYKLKEVDKGSKDALHDIKLKNCKTALELHLVLNYIELSVPANDIGKIINLLDGIFPSGLSFTFYSRSHLSVKYPSKFNRYSAYGLLQGSLSEVEFSKARALSQSEFNAKISGWVSENLVTELKNRFSEIRDFDSREDFEKIIRAIFHLANQHALTPNKSSTYIVGYDGKDLASKLHNYENSLAKKYYGETGGHLELKEFVRSLFLKAESPYTFEGSFIRYANSEFSENLPLLKSELSEIVIGYFKNYCLTAQKLDDNIWNLFYDTLQVNWISTGGNAYQKQKVMVDEAKEIMRAFILEKDFDGFLLESIHLEHFDQKLYMVSKTAEELFDGWTGFKQALEGKNKKKWIYLSEFKKFLSVYESKNFSEYVDFKFEKIPIHTKVRK